MSVNSYAKKFMNPDAIAVQIFQTYLQKSLKLTDKNMAHFMLRWYRATGEQRCIEPVVRYTLTELENDIQDFRCDHSVAVYKKRAERLWEKLTESKARRFTKRAKALIRKRYILFFEHIIERLFHWQQLGLHQGKLHAHFEKGVALVRHILTTTEMEEYLGNDDIVRYFGTPVMNSVYYMRFLNLTRKEKDFREKMTEIFPGKKDKKLPKYLFENKIYMYTHAIIAASEYYQHNVPYKAYQEVITYLQKNAPRILKTKNADIIAEVGLSFKLCQTGAREQGMMMEYLIRSFDAKKGYIPRGGRGIDAAEHKNAVACLFLKNVKRWYQGPDIRTLVEDRIFTADKDALRLHPESSISNSAMVGAKGA